MKYLNPILILVESYERFNIEALQSKVDFHRSERN